ncbi:MAG TPA: endo-1,4-beta-xylanase [Brevundimonas sp.]|jgi:endo-1,4-beta-xylanase
MTLSLDDAARSRQRYFGSAVRFDQLEQEPELRRRLLADCGSVTPEVHMKWDALNPSPDDWTFEGADDLATFAAANALKLRGHTLLWDQSTPAWAKTAMIRTHDWALVAQFIRTVVARYADHVDEWDVVNEPIDTDGLRANTFLRAYGPAYVERSLHEARAASARPRLLINDYGFDYDNPVEEGRRRSFLRLLEDLKTRGAPLDGVGVQAHLDLTKGPLRPEILRPFFAEIAGMGLSIDISELDVKEGDISRPTAERDRLVADEVRRYLDIALDEPAVRGVTTWGLSDRHSWLKAEGATGAALNRGLPYDDNLQPKPMRDALRSQLST